MAFTLVQAGTDLFPLNPDGGVGPALTLPTGMALASNRVPRFTRFRNYIILVNTPSRPLSIDSEGVVRPLTPIAPITPIALTAVSGGALLGNYLAEYTYAIKDAVGNVISESDYSPVMASSVATATQQLKADFTLSAESQVNAIRLFRTSAGPGASYFHWIDAFGSVGSITSAATDAQLDLIAKGVRGSAPDLTICVEHKDRLWGVSRDAVDILRYTEAGAMYAWGAANTLPIAHVGDDRYGITGIVSRRDSLVVGRQSRIVQVAGSTISDIRPIGVIENCGFLNQESIIVFRDTVYFLWRDGVYSLGSDGLTCLSDAAGVSSWFQTDVYFNRGMFGRSFADFDPVRMLYRLYLCSSGGTTPDRWVEYSLRTGKFYGPHKTDAFTVSCAMMVRGANDQLFPMVGSREGYISHDTSVRSDWDVVPIHMRVEMSGHDGGDPDSEKYFGQLSVQTEAEPAGTLTITPQVGADEDLVTGEPMEHDLTVVRERLDRIGTGRECVLTFENSELGQKVTIHGYEIEPVYVTGRR